MALDEKFYAGARVTSEGADPTHPIVITDGVHELGFVITDQAGDRDERTFRRFPHANPDQPYVTEKQSSFGGGFGQATFDDNRSKYWRGQGVDTIKDVLVLAPSFHYAKGSFVKAQDNLAYDTFGWSKTGSGGRTWTAVPFTPAQNWTGTTYLKLWCKRVGNPPNLRVRLYTNSGGEPNTQIHSVDFTPDSVITDPDGQWITLDITDTFSYVSGTQYWIVLTVTGTASGEWWFGQQRSNNGSLKSVDGSTWLSASWGLYFRIYGDNETYEAKWIDYKQQTYAVLQPDSSSDASLWMNGWRGVCDSNTGNLDSLLDATSQGDEWGSKITGDEVVRIIAGPASAEKDDYRQVSSGANNDITVTPDWIIAQNTYDEYVVQNSDWFQEITGGLWWSRVTDIAVSSGNMYILQAGVRGMVVHQEFNDSGAWDNSNWNGKAWVDAEFIKAMRDPIQGDVLFTGHNRSEMSEYKPFIALSQPSDYDSTTSSDYRTVAHNYGYSALNEYWESDVATYVGVSGGVNRAIITVIVDAITAVATNSTGANYQVNDILTIVDTGSSGTGKVKVLTVDGGGQPTSYEINSTGYDYTTGVKNTTGGSGDGNAQVNITSVSGSPSGLIAHIDFKDRDGTQRYEDLRYMNWIRTSVQFSMFVASNATTLSSTDMAFVLDDAQGAATPFETIYVTNMISDLGNDEPREFAIALSETSGAEVTTSIGLTMTAQSKSYEIVLKGAWQAWREYKPIDVGQVDGDNITGLEAWGDPEQLWVFTEAGYGTIQNNHFLPVPMREIKNARHANNGRGHEVSDVYLLFTWKGRVQRYYRQNLEDLGPDFPQGMNDISGDAVFIKSYPGRFYVAIDGGLNGRSMILCYKGGGWHEIFTSAVGERIRSLHVQAVEGKSDKLWASVGSDLMWFPLELQSAELPANTDYTYRPSGYLDTSWIYTTSKELDKVFRSILLTMDEAKNEDLIVNIYYKIDDLDDSWTKLAKEDFSASTKQFYLERFGSNARGNRIRFRIELTSRDLTASPIVRSLQARMYRVPEVKFSYTFITKLSTISVNLRGDEEKVAGQFKTVQQAFDLIDTWAATLQPLRVVSAIGAMRDKDVIIQPVPSQLLLLVHDEQIQEQSIQIQVDDA